MRLALLFIFGISSILARAQHIRPIRDVAEKLEQTDLRLIAERLVKERQYLPALDYYQRLEKEHGLENMDILAVGTLHYRLRNYQQALTYFQSGVKSGASEAYFEIGKLYMTQGQYDEAREAFSQLLGGNSSSDLKNRARVYLSNINISKAIAAGRSDPRLSIDNTKFNVSVSSARYGYDDQRFFNGSREIKVRKRYVINSDLTIEIDSIMIHRIYNGAAGMNELRMSPQPEYKSLFGGVTGVKKNEILFSVYDPFGSEDHSKIYSSVKNGSRWTEPSELTTRINTLNYSTKNPMVAQTSGGDTFLFFSSNRPGGYGGYDIWVSQYVFGEFGKPVNLGIGINTAEDEITPFFDVSTGYLFFSSNGHAGLGEMDVFLTRVNWGGGNGKTFNLGKLINTPFDDTNFSQSTTGKQGFIVSNRENSCCNRPIGLGFNTPLKYSELPPQYTEVTSFEQFDTELSMLRQSFNYEELAFNKSDTEFILKEDANIEGTITQGNLPVSNRKILLVDDSGEVISSTVSDNIGKFNFKQLPEGGQYRFVLDQQDPGLKIDIKFRRKDGQIFGRLNNNEKPQLFNFRQLDDYESGVWTLTVEDATISGQLLGSSVAGEKVLLVDESGNIVAAARADNKGRFSFKKLPVGEKYAFVLQAQDSPMSVDVFIEDNLGNVISEFSSRTSKQLFKYRELEDYEAGLFAMTAEDASISGTLVAGRLALGKRKVLLVDENGKVIGMAITDKSGNFTFRKLPPAQKYSFIIEESEADFNIDVAVLDENGNILTRFSNNNRQELFEFRLLKDYEDGVYTLNEDDASFNGILSDGVAGIASEVVLLVDDQGNTIDTSLTDGNGHFVFNNLNKGERYSFILSTSNMNKNISVNVLSSSGDIIESLDKRTRNEIFRYRDLSEEKSRFYAQHSTICGQFNEVTFVSSQIVLVNNQDDVVSCVEANRYGYFQFDDVPFEDGYKFLIDGCDTEIATNIEIVDATGATTNRISSAEDDEYFRYLDFTFQDSGLQNWIGQTVIDTNRLIVNILTNFKFLNA